MTKEQLSKEIKDLIRSIKTHYTFVEEEDRIPLIELELITSKIRKLYEKSIINNFLHANDETYMSLERARKMGSKRIFEKNTPDTYVRPNEPKEKVVEPQSANPIYVEKVSTVESVTGSHEPSLTFSRNIPDNQNTEKTILKDLKFLIGINDKFLLINNLFSRNDGEYKIAVEYLSTIKSYAESEAYLKLLANQNSWNVESYAFVRFLQIIEKRFK